MVGEQDAVVVVVGIVLLCCSNCCISIDSSRIGESALFFLFGCLARLGLVFREGGRNALRFPFVKINWVGFDLI